MRHYYGSVEECQKNMKQRENTNPRYKNFTQRDYTVGDTQQFDFVYRLHKGKAKTIDISENIFADVRKASELFEKYKNLDSTCTRSTFEYMFFKFKKGVYIKIKDNKLQLFQPFSNANFSNEWSSNIKFRYDVFREVAELDKRRFHKHKVNKFVKNWFANNHLVRYEYPVNETDTNLDVLKDMFLVLCKSRKLPDTEFFLNKRDYPLLTRDETEPYEAIWNGRTKKLVSHCEPKYVPILSMSSSDRFADVLIPTYEDWSRLERNNHKYFPSTFKRNYPKKFCTDWSSKKDIAVFRGSNTGNGVTVETNQRLKLCALSYDLERKGINLLDAGITKWNTRPRKEKGSKELQVIELNDIPFPLKEPLSPYEQSKYKYIINVDGHVSAYRLSMELGMNSVILKVDSEWNIWYSHLLKAYVHYIPVKSDFSDLIEKIQWCKRNERRCKQIAKNAVDFYDKYLCKESVLDYLQKTLVELKSFTGHYDSDRRDDSIFRTQINYLNESVSYPCINKPLDMNHILMCSHNNECFKTLEYLVNYLIIHDREPLTKGSVIFSNSKTTLLKGCLFGKDVAIKINTKSRSQEVVNSTFIGKNVVNNFIMRRVRGFAYTYNTFIHGNKLYSLSEYVKGVLLFDFMKSEDFTFDYYLNITLQICLCLQSVQDICRYIHNDLTPWNIIIKKLPKREVVEYRIGEEVYAIDTDIVPVILDYENSCFVLNNKAYGNITEDSVLVQDFLTYFITTLNVLMKNETFPDGVLLKLTNCLHFLGVAPYFTCMSKVKFFVYYNRKFDYLSRLHKKVDKNKTPLDLFYYMIGANKRNDFGFTVKGKITPQRFPYHPVAKFYELFNETESHSSDIDFPCDIDDVIGKYYSLYLLETYYSNSEFIDVLYKKESECKDYLISPNSSVDLYKLNDILSIILTYSYRISISDCEEKYLKHLKQNVIKLVHNNALNSFC